MRTVISALLTLLVSAAANAATPPDKVVLKLTAANGLPVTITVSRLDIGPDGAWIVDCTVTGACVTPTGPFGRVTTAPGTEFSVAPPLPTGQNVTAPGEGSGSD